MNNVNAVTLVAHLGKTTVRPVAGELVKWLDEHGVAVQMPEGDAQALGRPELGRPNPDLRSGDLAIALGGDGTILRAIRLLEGADVPLVGVNLGKFGFLAEIEVDALFPSMNRLIAGDFRVEKRMMLECEVLADGKKTRRLALNEIVVERGYQQRMLELDAYVDGMLFNHYTADGLIFATPTGSTAYSFSAGGPIVAPEHELILMTPICPHSLFGRTVIFGTGAQLRVKVPSPMEVLVGTDGVPLARSENVQEAAIRKADAKASLVRLSERSFYEVLKDKLGVWGLKGDANA